MEVFIYYYQPLNRGRDEIEDQLTEGLADLSCDVTGSGSGSSGGNFDLTVSDEFPEREVFSIIAKQLRDIGFHGDTKISSGDLKLTLEEALA